MTELEHVARAVLAGDAIGARSLVQDWLRTRPTVTDVEPPVATVEPSVRSLAAGLAELFAERLGQRPPSWAATVGPSAEPTFLLEAARRMPRLRATCEAEAPLPLRRRRFFAPANYLEAV